MDEILSLTQKLITLHTTADNLPAINESILLVEKQLQSYSYKKFISQGKPSLLIHNAKPNTKQFKILFNAHLDVIQGEDYQFKPHSKKNKLYGRGSYDMKAATAVFITLFKELHSKIKYPFALQITTDEETGSHGAQNQIDSGYRAEFILTGECGSNLKITNFAKGVYMVKIIADGVASHGAYPWKGDNAIAKLHKALEPIMTKYPLPKKETNNSTVNITKIYSTNEAVNRTPDYAEASLDIRYIPADNTIIPEITKLLPHGVRLEKTAHYSPLNTDEKNKYIVLLRNIGYQKLHQKIPLRSAHATSDIVRFVEVGCEGIEFGPIGDNQHGYDEWVDINSLENYYHILKQFLLSVNNML
jgi:succinyl-diaminopimelate desuccinylase